MEGIENRCDTTREAEALILCQGDEFFIRQGMSGNRRISSDAVLAVNVCIVGNWQSRLSKTPKQLDLLLKGFVLRIFTGKSKYVRVVKEHYIVIVVQ